MQISFCTYEEEGMIQSGTQNRNELTQAFDILDPCVWHLEEEGQEGQGYFWRIPSGSQFDILDHFGPISLAILAAILAPKIFP